MPRRSSYGRGAIANSKHDVVTRVIAPFTAIAERAESEMAGAIANAWAWEKYGKESAEMAAAFPELWKRASKSQTIRTDSYNTYPASFQYLDQVTPPFRLNSLEAQAFASDEQKDTLTRVKELRDKGKRLKDLLYQWLDQSGCGTWEVATFWFADLKAWVPDTKTQKRPRVGSPPSPELHQLVREAALLKDSVRS